MKIRIVAVGRVKRGALRELLDDYVGRLRRYCAVEEVELKDGPRVAEQIAKAASEATLVALDVRGQALSSRQLARRLERLASRGKGVVAFAIGGADGLPPAILEAAHKRWSLSSLTFPHRLARLVLSEQLYRGMTILRGEPYDH